MAKSEINTAALRKEYRQRAARALAVYSRASKLRNEVIKDIPLYGRWVNVHRVTLVPGRLYYISRTEGRSLKTFGEPAVMRWTDGGWRTPNMDSLDTIPSGGGGLAVFVSSRQ